MARIDKALLIADVAEVACRVNLVVQDPAVEKAARTVRDDIVQAGRSSTEFGREIIAAWHRTAPAARRDSPE